MLPSTPSTPRSSSTTTPPPSLQTTLAPFSTTSLPRLQALYSDFSRQKQANPTSYHANVGWWKKALEELVLSGQQEVVVGTSGTNGTATGKNDRLVLHAGRDLMERVKIPKVGKPLALGAVLVRISHLFHTPQTLTTHSALAIVRPPLDQSCLSPADLPGVHCVHL